jgi:hypothetical protein
LPTTTAPSPKAKATGLVKVMVVKGRPVGASIAGPQAGELIGFWTLAIATRLKMSAIAGRAGAALSDAGGGFQTRVGCLFSPQLFDNPVLKRLCGWCSVP